MKDLTLSSLIEQGYTRIGSISKNIDLYAAFTPEEISKEKYVQCHIVDICNGISMGIAFNIPLNVVEIINNKKDQLKRIESIAN